MPRTSDYCRDFYPGTSLCRVDQFSVMTIIYQAGCRLLVFMASRFRCFSVLRATHVGMSGRPARDGILYVVMIVVTETVLLVPLETGVPMPTLSSACWMFHYLLDVV